MRRTIHELKSPPHSGRRTWRSQFRFGHSLLQPCKFACSFLLAHAVRQSLIWDCVFHFDSLGASRTFCSFSLSIMKVLVYLSLLFFSSVLASPETSNGDADYAPTKEGNLRSLQSDSFIPVPAPVSCDTCPCGYNDGCNVCSCNEGGIPFCTLRPCSPEELGKPSCNKCEDRCCDLSDRPTGAIEAPLCCPDGTWVGNIGDGSGTCPNGVVVSSLLGNEGRVCQPTCDDCPCGYNDGCNECSCGRDGSASCTELACLVQGTPFCKECPASDKCCDPRKEPGMFGNPPFFEGHRCCGVTGEWVGSIGDGKTFFCGKQLITSGFGKPCEDDIFCTEDVKTCPDGSFVGRDPENGCNFFPCEVQCPPKRRWCRWTRRWVGLDPSKNCKEYFPCFPWHW